ncbi:protein translocase subunit SecD [Sphingomonas morindae]|uniref:Protein translocase subunit SecD n=1 Tax=Sphingomonas morindae TaxID=1541170 RepID=A0ABY4XAM9_9SPHN|nr:protein translocase subunit SecD [Sphingomonas morindae]USI73791.1 protein translocase subunit SecD [Sphingomonas morindae]
MLDFPRWKILSIFGVLLLGVLLAVPSLMPDHTARALGLGGMPRINLGLDLAGGSHILLEADTADVAKTRVAAMEDSVRDSMHAMQPAIDIGDISTADGALSFFVRDPARVDAAVEKIRTLTAPVGSTGTRDWDVKVVDSTRIVLTPTQGGINQFVDQAMKGATDIVRKRIDALGTKEPTIVRQGSDRILVQVPGLQDPAKLKALIGKTAKLEFKLVDTQADPQKVAAGQAPIGDQILRYQNGAPIAVKRRAIITGTDLAKAAQDYDGQTNEPVVSITFGSKGARAFAEVTQQNVGKPFAIVLDNVVLSAPSINEPILGGAARINGNFTVDSAQQLAISLQSGALPIALKTVEERTVGPGLGADSIHAGVVASAIAVALVVAFMLVTYGRFGVYANLAVILNIFVILAAMALLNATLTLPGIAGFVLTIGTAVDANVLINERIREERRRGRNVVQAVELGYKEASRTIFEANVTHAIAGTIMLLLGSGPVKGFAVVLLLGIVTSVFTAVTFTRMLVALWLKRHRPQAIHI